MSDLSLLFKALSEPLRLRIVRLLLDSGREAYGEELAKALHIPPYQLSRHLKVLRATGLIQERREGRWVYYSIAKRNGDRLGVICRMIAEAELPKRNGLGPKPGRARRAVAKSLEDDFNWNQGPAVPGVL